MPITWTLGRLKQEDCKVGSSGLHKESLSQNTGNLEAAEMAVEGSAQAWSPEWIRMCWESETPKQPVVRCDAEATGSREHCTLLPWYVQQKTRETLPQIKVDREDGVCV